MGTPLLAETGVIADRDHHDDHFRFGPSYQELTPNCPQRQNALHVRYEGRMKPPKGQIRRRIAISDGGRLWLLFRNPQWSRRWLALMRLGAELKEGVLPESLSADYLAEAVAHRDDAPDTIAAHGLAYAAAFHQHKDAEAGQFLETCLRFSSWASPFQREALISDAAVFQARRRKRADLAEQWLAVMPQPTRSPWLRTKVEAGILEARGDMEGALRKLEELETAILAFPDQAQSKMFLRLVERWRSELRGQAP